MEYLFGDLSGKVIECACLVHSELGPGLLESSYEACLYYELNKNKIEVKKQAPMPLIYEGVKLDIGYRIDLLVDNKIVVEVKSVDYVNPIHIAQVLTYLKLSGCRIGLLLNFNVKSMKDGIKRYIL